MKESEDISGYGFRNHLPLNSHGYLMPVVLQELKSHFASADKGQDVFDLGCGNGATANYLSERDYHITGVDPSSDGIEAASKNYPNLKLETGSAYEDLFSKYGEFPAVISLEVVEHVYDPRSYMKTLFSLVEPGGIGIISTPYHGYAKNLFIALTGKFDKHVSPLWDHGHIKFWSIDTLGSLITEVGFLEPRFHRVGRRLPALAKSMVAIAQKPLKTGSK